MSDVLLVNYLSAWRKELSSHLTLCRCAGRTRVVGYDCTLGGITESVRMEPVLRALGGILMQCYIIYIERN